MTRSFEDCDWLVVQEGSKSALRVGLLYAFTLKLQAYFSCFTVLSLSLSLSLSRARAHAHTHTHTLYSLFFIYHAVILNVFYRK